MLIIKKISILTVLLFISACAYTPQKAVLNPIIESNSIIDGAGKEVFLQVEDDRDTEVLGKRGANGIGAQITVTNAADPIYQSFTDALEKAGFSVLDSKSSKAASVNLRLRHFGYTISTGFASGTTHVTSSIRAEVDKNGNKFERTYKGKADEEIFAILGEEGNQKLIDRAISDNLSKVINDREFVSFLKK